MARKKGARQPHAITAFAARLRDARHRAGLSQYALAKGAEMSHAYLARLERGEVNPGLDGIVRLAETLQVEVESLVGGTTKPAEPLKAVRERLKTAVDRLVAHDDIAAMQALALLANLVEASLARRHP